ncbi:multicopper oxidase family protein [Acidisoma sp. 7E03]
MSSFLSRRGFLSGMTAAGAIAGFVPHPAHAAPAGRRLLATSATLDVKGRSARVLRLVNDAGRPRLTLDPGEAFQVTLENRLAEKTIVHWHGQLPPWQQDGFPWPQTPPLPPGGRAAYDFTPIPGTFWMHSHQDLQEQALLAAPLIVRSQAERAEDRQEVVLMLHDFSFRPPAELLAGLTHQAAGQGMSMDMPADKTMTMDMGMGGTMDMGMPMAKAPGQSSTMPAMDLNDIAYDAFLANDRTLDDPEVVPVAPGGRLHLRVINGASSSAFWLDLGSLQATVAAVDGHPVLPVTGSRFPLSIAQRIDLLIDLPTGGGSFPILAQLEGSPQRTGLILATPGAAVTRIASDADQAAPAVDNSLERRLRAAAPLAQRRTDQRARILLGGGMQPYRWTLNGEAWPQVTPLMLKAGARVEIDLVNQTMMAHPMHLHGHAFQVLELDGQPIAGAVRDTVLVEAGRQVRIGFDAVNPGRWALHCHNLYHMMTGMMTELRYQGLAV